MKRALFVCTGNRARSQMAEGLLRHLAGDRFEVESAGTRPSGLGEATVNVMAEIGIDISSQWSKHVDELAGKRFDFVITVCDSAKEACPTFPGEGMRLHWSVEDPIEPQRRGASLEEALREARDELRSRIEGFLREEGAG